MAVKADTHPLETGDLAKTLVRGSLPGETQGFGKRERAAAAEFLAPLLERFRPGQRQIRIATYANRSGQRMMRLAIVHDNMPFLVDSIAAILASRAIRVDRLLHPVIAAGQVSVIYVEAERAEAKARTAIQNQIEASLDAVRAAVDDWPAMREALRQDAIAAQGEGSAFLTWAADDHFTLLGTQDADGALGLGRIAGPAFLADVSIKAAISWFRGGHSGPLIIKSNMVSAVHRRVPLDLIIMPRRTGSKVIGIAIHAGLWTSNALAMAPGLVPILRTHLAKLQARYRFDAKGHAGKAMAHALATLPHDILVSIDSGALERVTLTAMSIADRPRVAVELVEAPLGRHVFAFVWLPRDELTTARRIAIGESLARAGGGKLINWSLSLGDGGAALLRFDFDMRTASGFASQATLEAEFETLVRGWPRAIEAALAAHGEAGQATRLAIRFADAFPQTYQLGAAADEAAHDILRLHRLADDQTHDVRLYRLADDAPSVLRLKHYSLAPATLSETVPALENFGFKAVEEATTVLADGLGYIQSFVLEAPAGQDANALMNAAARLEPAIAAVFAGESEDDHFNALMSVLGLEQFAVILFRALFRYLRQTGMAYGLLTVVDVLRRAPNVSTALAALFSARHDPDLANRSKKAKLAEADIAEGLTHVAAIDDDRILRAMRSVINATLRTNAYAPAGRQALAFKLDSSLVAGLPEPRPWREIFVYSPRVEGIHLRAGPVARGGLRWSDRRDDFRTEVLGLMKAQRVKNAVIVPTGAKGGFHPKQLPDPADRAAWLAEGTESYRIFIRSLLSITDNLSGGKVVKPERVICLDGDDPYFVVAADKGTASFSDVANAIAQDRGFWLGDAFASGGSVGYDHKAMGITAKGGWVSVNRHFAEMGVDVQSEPVTIAGCGDMSGDVFGNGMLLSKSIKLVAAFDHRHFFLDPDPDPATSWAERERLFNQPRSSWADYDAKLISKGGGVFPRSAKTIMLSPEVQALLGLSTAELEPSALIAAILKAQVDLLWFGGIGTYIKARSEGHADVGDRANDANRVNAEDVRAKVIGEGANLGVTQAGRISFALNKGRINTDFIDNSAGVDCSDNEVNIKIALNAAMMTGGLTLAARNKMLVRMTDDVARLVLENNRLQTLALSVAEAEGARALPAQMRLIEYFEANGRLDRAVEGIAANDELQRRAESGHGLTRPELAVVMATAKLTLQDAIEQSGLGDDPAALDYLISAFPPEMQRKHRAEIETHRLRREIIATKLSNHLVNRLGLIHPFELAEEEGCQLDDVAEAFVIAEQVHGTRALWADIDREPMPEATRLMLFDQVATELRAHMADILRNSIAGRRNDHAVAEYAPLVRQLAVQLDKLLPTEARKQAQAFEARLVAKGAPVALANRIVRLAETDGAIGLAALSARQKIDIVAATSAFTMLGEALGLDWAQGSAMQLDPLDPWERLLAAGIARDFQAMRLDFLKRHGGTKPVATVHAWIDANQTRVSSFHAMIGRARLTHPTTAMLAQIAGQARVLLNR